MLKTVLFDYEHLQRMTFSDVNLQKEVLDMFRYQVGDLMSRMLDEQGRVQQDVAHTLKGSARSIGAVRVANYAEQLETAAEGEVDMVISDLNKAIFDTMDQFSTQVL